MDSAEIEDLHIDDFTDLSAVSPNVRIVDTGYSGTTGFIVRGFSNCPLSLILRSFAVVMR